MVVEPTREGGMCNYVGPNVLFHHSNDLLTGPLHNSTIRHGANSGASPPPEFHPVRAVHDQHAHEMATTITRPGTL